MANWKLKGIRGNQRRRFLKMMGLVGAGLGLERTRLLNYLADEGGHGLAEAALSDSQRALMVTCGNGVYAWMQELWPHWEIANRSLGSLAVNGTGAPDNKFAGEVAWLYHEGFANSDRRWSNDPNFDGYYGTFIDGGAPGGGNDHPFFYGPHAPWFDRTTNTPKRPMSAFMAGKTEVHTPFPATANKVSGSDTMTAVVGAIQTKHTIAIVPTIGIDPLLYGSAAGAPEVATAPSAEGIVSLFNSAASRFVLDAPSDQKLFETYYKATIGLRRSAARSPWQPELQIAKGAAKLIGLNFATELTPTEEDLAAYGVFDIQGDSQLMTENRVGLDKFARTLAVVARAFKLGLSNSAVVGLAPGSTVDTNWTDPHATFSGTQNVQNGRSTTRYLGRALDAFYDDLSSAYDPESPGETLDNNTTFMCWGDTPHTPSNFSGWDDNTPSDTNWIYVMDPKQLIHHGWFGRVDATKSNNGTGIYGFDPVEGTDVAGQASQLTSTVAGAAAAYSVARGDWNVVSQFYKGAKPEGLLKA